MRASMPRSATSATPRTSVSRILRLALLAPDMVDAILAGRADQSLTLVRLERPLPASWEEQRGLLDRPRHHNRHPASRSSHQETLADARRC
jgi:hypothetical protein